MLMVVYYLAVNDMCAVCISQVVATRDKVEGKKVPLLVKIAPDLSMQQKKDIASVVSKKGVSKWYFLVFGITAFSALTSVTCWELGKDIWLWTKDEILLLAVH